MSRELDVRDFTHNRVTPQRALELQSSASSISDRLPGAHRIRVDRLNPTTGTAAHIVSEASPPTPDGNFIKRALDHVQAIGPAMGLTNQAAEFVADPTVQQTSSGARAVNLQQRYKGIPIFQAATTVRFAPDGTITDTTGTTIAVAQDASTLPQLSARDAVLRAAEYVTTHDADDRAQVDQFGQPMPPPHVDLTGFTPKVHAAFPELAGTADRAGGRSVRRGDQGQPRLVLAV